jgi:hypothetical protein
MTYTDNDLIRLFLPIIQAGLIADGFSDVTVKQANQPTQQGVNSSPTVYFFKVSNKRYGFLGRFDKWNASEIVHTESQYYEITFQISALVRQFPITPTQYTASDLVNEVASIMQADTTLAILNNAGVGILRIMNILNPYFTDDKDQFEASPSFDFTLTYQGSRVSSTPMVQLPIALDIQGV